MKYRMRLQGVQLALVVFLAQASIGVLIAGLMGWLVGAEGAMAALLGAAVAVLPGLFFAARVFRPVDESAPKAWLSAVYGGEAGKLVLTALMFAVAAIFMPAQFAIVILTYVVCLAIYWIVLVVN